ncbi:MAG: DUF192 domain-containing protein [Patescibacteria group bacterium]
MKKKLFVTIALVILSAGICVAAFIFAAPSAAVMRHDQAVTLNGKTLNLEIARTPASIVQGLSGRKRMTKDEGMLFIMPNVENQNFWMKDMKFALDIVYLREGKVVDIATLQRPSLAGIPSHQSVTEADMVLELNEGMVKEYKLEIGTQTDLNSLR